MKQSLVLISTLLLSLANAAEKRDLEPKNWSSLKVKKTHLQYAALTSKGSPNLPIDQCSGSVNTRTPLSKVKLTKQLLAKGVYCVTADFDGNGSLDFDLWGELYSPGHGYTKTRDHLVLLFDKEKITAESTIEWQEVLFKYEPTKEKGRYGEPKTNLPGLIAPGEGDPTDIYLYDSKERKFIHTKYQSEKDES